MDLDQKSLYRASLGTFNYSCKFWQFTQIWNSRHGHATDQKEIKSCKYVFPRLFYLNFVLLFGFKTLIEATKRVLSYIISEKVGQIDFEFIIYQQAISCIVPGKKENYLWYISWGAESRVLLLLLLLILRKLFS